MKKILIVDDEPLILYSLTKALQSDRIYVRGVRDGESALEEIGTCFYNLCVLDIYIPVINGIEVMKTIKRLSPETRILVMSAREISDDMMREIEDNAAMFIAKPFLLNEMKHLINQQINTSRKDYAFYEKVFEKEKRVYSRIPFFKPIEYSVEVFNLRELMVKRLYLSGEVIDISHTGAGIQTNYPIKYSQVLTFNNGIERHSGVVMWSTMNNNRVCKAGVKFV